MKPPPEYSTLQRSQQQYRTDSRPESRTDSRLNDKRTLDSTDSSGGRVQVTHTYSQQQQQQSYEQRNGGLTNGSLEQHHLPRETSTPGNDSNDRFMQPYG